MDLATVLLLHKSSFIVGMICFTYVGWRSQELGLGFLALGSCFLAVASTLAGMNEQGTVAFEVGTIGSFAIGIVGYSLMATGLLQVSGRQRRQSHSLLIAAALLLSTLVAGTGWYAENYTRAAIFNAGAATFLAIASFKLIKDYLVEPLPARLGVIASLWAVSAFSALVTFGMLFPDYAPISSRFAFFLLIICHFGLALFVLVLVNERAEAKLRKLASTDALTGIPNRQCFLASLPTKPRQGDAFMMIDIDHFKNINDCYGHATGDAVLVGVAQALAKEAGKEASFGRLGGEEFGLFLSQLTENSAFAKADEVRRSIEAFVFTDDTATIPSTVSIGLAVCRGSEEMSILRNQADQALYRAKRDGRNRVEVFASVNEGARLDRRPRERKQVA